MTRDRVLLAALMAELAHDSPRRYSSARPIPARGSLPIFLHMPRDIEKLAADLQRAYPGITVDRIREPQPGDEDGLWRIRHPEGLTDVQVMSGTGDAPFLVESEFAPPTPARSVESAVRLVTRRLGLGLGAD